jgi:hypothetical protein
MSGHAPATARGRHRRRFSAYRAAVVVMSTLILVTAAAILPAAGFALASLGYVR